MAGTNSTANNFLSSLGNLGSTGGSFLTTLGSDYAQKHGKSGFTDSELEAQSTFNNFIGMIPEYGQLISLGLGALNGIGAATGINVGSFSKDSAEKAGIKGGWMNTALNSIPGLSTVAGMNIFAQPFLERTDKFGEISDEIKGMSDGYSGVLSDLEAAQDLSGKRLFKGQASKANDFIADAKNKVSILENINRVNTQRKQSDYYQDLQNQTINRYAGQNYLNMTVGRNGMKLMSIEEARKIVALRKESPEKLQNGGNIPGIDTNILPEGNLHKELNHLSDINPDLEDMTKKGIPVAESTDNQQVAEIERDELICRLEVTQKLEELMKDGSEEAMIEAGKLLTSEIIENTQDNTGQITEDNGDTNSNDKQ